MNFWRISNHKELDGRGGLFASARWHSKGRPIVYLAATPAGALVEALIHLELDPSHLPKNYQLMKVEAPDELEVALLDAKSLPDNWRENLIITRSKGDEWLERGETALLNVPSAILPDTANILLNPNHPDARSLRILSHVKYPYDRRIFKPGE